DVRPVDPGRPPCWINPRRLAATAKAPRMRGESGHLGATSAALGAGVGQAAGKRADAAQRTHHDASPGRRRTPSRTRQCTLSATFGTFSPVGVHAPGTQLQRTVAGLLDQFAIVASEHYNACP